MGRFWVGAALSVLSMAVAWDARAQEAAATPGRGLAIEDFIAGPTLSRVSISPSGQHLAMVVTSGETSRLAVQDLATGQYRALLEANFNESFGGSGFDWYHWKDDDRLLVAARLVEVQRRRGADDGRVLSFRAGRTVLAVARDGSGVTQLRAPGTEPGDPGEVIDVLDNAPDHILMTVEDWREVLNVVRVDLRTGESEPVLSGDHRTVAYYTDHNGEIVARLRRAGLSGRRHAIESRDLATGDWVHVAEITPNDLRDMNDFDILSSAENPGELYVVVRPETGEQPDTTAVHIYDMRARELGPPLWRNDRYDLHSILMHPETGAFLAGCYRADVLECDFANAALGVHMTALSRFFEGTRDIDLVSQTRDNSKWVLFVTGPDEPGTYYLYDLEARSVDIIGEAYGRVALEGLGEMRRIDYAARDGAELHGYLTVPPGEAGANAPLVVMPHGGPEVRDSFAYDRWVQFLASRGYAVFQPNFRGSAGFGRAFVEAGYGQWGGRMQEDVTDGVMHLIAEGVADPARICIMGASYGGYAALWGGASQPDLYRCVISIAGVSDLPAIMRWERRVSGHSSDAYDYWRASIGDPGRDRDRLQSFSPIRFAEDWRPPVLLIHGDQDDIVPHAQSRDMDRALRRAGKDVRFITLEGESHSGWRQDDHILALSEIETFLARHLPVAAAPPSDQP